MADTFGGPAGPHLLDFMRYLCASVVGLVLIMAGASKLRRPEKFEAGIVRKLLPKKAGILRVFSRSLGVLELALGLMFVIGKSASVVGLVIVGVLTAFSLTLGLFILRGESVQCGCFGEDEGELVRPVPFIARNTALILLALAGMWSRIEEFELKEAVLANLMALGLLCLYGLAHAHAAITGTTKDVPETTGQGVSFDRSST